MVELRKVKTKKHIRESEDEADLLKGSKKRRKEGSMS
jgi:hypothetical protein